MSSTALVKISAVSAHEVVVPARSGAVNSPELGSFLLQPGRASDPDWDMLPICVLEFQMSDGLTALGEVGRGVSLAQIEPWLKQLPGIHLAGTSLAVLPESWRGAPLFGGLLESSPPPLYSSPSPVAYALEMALYDWAGKRLGCRMVDLLGGAYVEELPVDYWCGRQSPANLASIAERAVSLGFKGIKMKSRMGDPVIEQVRALRSVGGSDFSITIDPMYQWLSPHDGLHYLKGLEQFGGNLRVEDPFPTDVPEFWHRARAASSVPLVVHARGMLSLRRALEEKYADNFNCAGGPVEFLTCARAVEVAGYSCWHGSSLELGIGQAAGMHAAAAARSCTMASDFQSGVIREHTLITWDWPYKDGMLPLPAGLGLGVELDRDALRHYTKSEARFE